MAFPVVGCKFESTLRIFLVTPMVHNRTSFSVFTCLRKYSCLFAGCSRGGCIFGILPSLKLEDERKLLKLRPKLCFSFLRLRNTIYRFDLTHCPVKLGAF